MKVGHVVSTTLRLESISKTYQGLFSLQVRDLRIEEGEFFSLIGPSGCGKTTLLKIIAGLLQPDEGEVWLGSQGITHVLAEKRGFGMVFQQPLLFPHMTVEDNVAFGLKMQGIPKKVRLKLAHGMLEAVGLAGYGKRHPSELSGGQQQRVSLARALVGRPKLLLMDEPFSALDVEIREEMRVLVKQMHHDYRVTILFVTHDRDEAILLSDRIGVMKEGRMLQVGIPKELYKDPVHPYVASVLGAKNIWDGELRNGWFYSKDIKVKCCDNSERPDQQGWLILRPETLRVVRKDENVTETESILEGIIKQISFRQGFNHIQLTLGSLTLHVTEKADREDVFLIGQQLSVRFNRQNVQFLPDLQQRGDRDNYA
jgi:ABC-type Fe3+/spermidine/putrescine transport system ATPase subunit